MIRVFIEYGEPMHAERQQKSGAVQLTGAALPEHPLQSALGTSLFKRLLQLRVQLEQVASKDTAYDAKAYEQSGSDCPLYGHCAAVAYLVRKEFGGDIVGARVQGEPHQWNRLASGVEIDLTGDQFGLDGLTSVSDWPAEISHTNPRKVPLRKSVNKRFLLLETRLQESVE